MCRKQADMTQSTSPIDQTDGFFYKQRTAYSSLLRTLFIFYLLTYLSDCATALIGIQERRSILTAFVGGHTVYWAGTDQSILPLFQLNFKIDDFRPEMFAQMLKRRYLTIEQSRLFPFKRDYSRFLLYIQNFFQ